MPTYLHAGLPTYSTYITYLSAYCTVPISMAQYLPYLPVPTGYVRVLVPTSYCTAAYSTVRVSTFVRVHS